MDRTSHLKTAIALLTLAAVFLFVLLSLQYVQDLVHRFNPTRRELSRLGQTLRDNSPVPLAAALAVAVFFLLEDRLSAIYPPPVPRDIPFGASWKLMAPALVVLVALGGFWATDGPHMPWQAGDLGLNPYRLSSGILAAGLLAGIVAGVVLRGRGGAGQWLSLLPPAACIVGIAWLADRIATGARRDGMELPTAFPTPLPSALAVGLAAALAGSLALAERRRGGSVRHSTGLFCAGLWVVAALQARGVLAPGHWACTVPGQAYVETIAIAVILAAFLLAMLVRLAVHERRKKHRDWMTGRRAEEEARYEHVGP